MALSKQDKVSTKAAEEAKAEEAKAEEAKAEEAKAEEVEPRVATIILVTPYRQVHPVTGQEFMPNNPVLKVPVDNWVKTMLEANCFEEA